MTGCFQIPLVHGNGLLKTVQSHLLLIYGIMLGDVWTDNLPFISCEFENICDCKILLKFYLPSVMYNSNSFILTSLLQIQKSFLDHAILFSSDPQDTTETPFHNAPWLLHKDRHKGEFVTNKPLSDHLFSCCFWKYHTNDTQKHYQKMYSAMNNLFLS